MPPYAVAALYRFVPLNDLPTLRTTLRQGLDDHGLCGTLLLASEGINGTIAGLPDALHSFVDDLRNPTQHRGAFVDLDVKWSTAEQLPFRKTRVHLKPEIVTLGVPNLNACDPQNVGQYVDPHQWNQILDDPAVTVIDTRNDYEIAIGTFVGVNGPAVNPQTPTFGHFPSFADDQLNPNTHPQIAMFCTGGIRCEKSTALLKSQGFDHVYHLRGGILKYLEQIPETQSRWQGACFVFDRRVAVTHGLAETDHELCFACGWPVTPDDRAHPDFRPGISCHRCIRRYTPEQQSRFATRQQQLDAVSQQPRP